MISKIIGNGLLASAFHNSNSKECIFFCSGVSNSSEQNLAEFEREANLFKKVIDDNYCIVYFSSVLAPKKTNKYYEHKYKMEQLVKSLSKEYIIVRLPQVAGDVVNNTLLSNFIKKIYFDEKIEVYKNAPRSLIDVDDVVKIFDSLYKKNIRNKTINFCLGYEFQPVELAKIIGELLGKNPKIEVVDKESIQICEQDSLLSEHLGLLGDLNTYLQRVTAKYTKSIVSKIKYDMKS